MKPNDFFKARTLLVAFSLFLALQTYAAQFVELTAEVEGQDWGYHLFEDRLIKERDRPEPDTLFRRSRTIRCVVGTNLWMMEDTNGDHVMQWWFTGTKFVEIRKESGKDAVTALNIHESVDGNPGRPVRVVDWMDITARSGWLAFCSAPTLKHEGRTIYPTSDLWKEYFAGWKDKTTVFPDDLGLPRSIDLVATNNQPIFQYQAHLMTNFMGWTFPKEFFSVQYMRSYSNGFTLEITMKGRVTSIREGAEPKVPEDVLKRAKH